MSNEHCFGDRCLGAFICLCGCAKCGVASEVTLEEVEKLADGTGLYFHPYTAVYDGKVRFSQTTPYPQWPEQNA